MARAVDELLEPVQEQRGVRHARQGVVIGQEVGALLVLYRFERKGDVAGQFVEQLALLVVKRTGAARVQQHHADHAARRVQRQAQHGMVAARPRVGAVGATVGRHLAVVAHGRRAVVQHVGHDVARRRRQPGGGGGAVHAGRQGDGLAGVGQAYPCMAEAAVGHGDAARFLQQGQRLADAHDGAVGAAQHGVDTAQACRLGLLQLQFPHVVFQLGGPHQRQLVAHPGMDQGRRHGLDDVVDGAAGKAGGLIAHLAHRGYEDHRGVFRQRVALQAAAHGVAVHVRHLHVEQDQDGPVLAGRGQAFGAVAGKGQRVLVAEDLLQQRQVARFVIDDQDGTCLHDLLPCCHVQLRHQFPRQRLGRAEVEIVDAGPQLAGAGGADAGR